MFETIKALFTHSVLSLLMVNARILPIILLLPGIGENFVSGRVRLIISLLLSLLIIPLLGKIAIDKPSIAVITSFLANEILIGFMIGAAIKMIVSTMNIAGHIISNQSGLASAQMFDPMHATQSTLESNFMNMVLIILILVTNSHHWFIAGIFESYKIYPIYQLLNLEQTSHMFSSLLNNIFNIALKIAAPHIIIITLVFIASGVISKIMPNVQIFFIILPVQIVVSFIILFVTLSFVTMWFIDEISMLLQKFIF